VQDPPSPPLDPAPVAAALRAASIDLGTPVQVRLLAGGYSWRTYRLSGPDGASVVLRIAPRGGTLEPYDPLAEARAIEASRGAVPAPRVLAVHRGRDPFGDPYLIQSTAPGEVLRLSAVTDEAERSKYRVTFARTLARLHDHGDPAALGSARTVGQALRDEIERVAERYLRAARWPRPGFEIGLRWLLTHLPDVPEPSVFCHGDYRFGNLTWTGPGELGAVLDWERAWRGDPMTDVAFTRVYSGWCAVSGAAVAEYERTGRRVDEGRLVYAARFERVRSYTASMLGSQAFRDGRSADSRLLGIGAAGERGMAELTDWLADGPLAALPARWRAPADGVAFPACSPAAVRASAGELRGCAVPADLAGPLAAALGGSDEELAWRRAFTLLAPLAATGGAELVPALRALARAAVGEFQTNG
jgi:aminoglycoside phosphotransferase (APT) family kinase protein